MAQGRAEGSASYSLPPWTPLQLQLELPPINSTPITDVDAQPAQDRGARRLPGGRYTTSPYYEQGYYGYGSYGAAAGPYGYHAAAAYSPMYTPNPYGTYAGYGGYYGGGYGDAYGCAEGGYNAIRRGDEGQSGGSSRPARGAPY